MLASSFPFSESNLSKLIFGFFMKVIVYCKDLGALTFFFMFFYISIAEKNYQKVLLKIKAKYKR
jgi:hypothetical protein